MKKFIALFSVIVLSGGIGWWALGRPRASEANGLPAQMVPLSDSLPSPAVDPGPPIWRSNLQSATAEARDHNKDVLLLFTGNGPSAIQTPAETRLASEEFRKSAADRFILATFNCHPDSSLADDSAATRDTWAERLGVKTFPFLVLLDGRGRACGAVDLRNVDADALDGTINDLRSQRLKRDDAFARADSQTGVEQAATLNVGLQFVKPFIPACYQQVMEQIVADDPNDNAHLREIYFPLVTQSRIDLAVQHEIYPLIDRRLYQAAIDRITQLISEESPPPNQMQLLLAFKGQLFSNLGDNKSALSTLDQAIAMAPDNEQATKIKTVRDQLEQQAIKPN